MSDDPVSDNIDLVVDVARRAARHIETEIPSQTRSASSCLLLAYNQALREEFEKARVYWAQLDPVRLRIAERICKEAGSQDDNLPVTRLEIMVAKVGDSVYKCPSFDYNLRPLWLMVFENLPSMIEEQT